MTIEKMRPEHICGVKALLDHCFGESAWSVENIRAELSKPSSTCFVATEDNRVIAYMAFEKILDEGSVIELAVDAAHRRKGLASCLMEQVLGAYDDLSTIYLEVRRSNTPAVALYHSLGFTQASIREGYYDHPREDAIIMTKVI